MNSEEIKKVEKEELPKVKAAEDNGWTDVHDGPPNGAYWRGINPLTKKMEKIPDDQMVDAVDKSDTAICSLWICPSCDNYLRLVPTNWIGKKVKWFTSIEYTIKECSEGCGYAELVYNPHRIWHHRGVRSRAFISNATSKQKIHLFFRGWRPHYSGSCWQKKGRRV